SRRLAGAPILSQLTGSTHNLMACGVGSFGYLSIRAVAPERIRGLEVAKTIDLELTRAEVEVIELEARLRVVPMNDTQLSDALKAALAAKKERLAKLRTQHAAAGKPRRGTQDGDGARSEERRVGTGWRSGGELR